MSDYVSNTAALLEVLLDKQNVCFLPDRLLILKEIDDRDYDPHVITRPKLRRSSASCHPPMFHFDKEAKYFYDKYGQNLNEFFKENQNHSDYELWRKWKWNEERCTNLWYDLQKKGELTVRNLS